MEELKSLDFKGSKVSKIIKPVLLTGALLSVAACSVKHEVTVNQALFPPPQVESLHELGQQLIEMNERLDDLQWQLQLTKSMIYALEDSYVISRDTVGQLNLRTRGFLLSAKQLDSAMKHDLQGKAEEILQMSEEYRINPFFICAVAALESGWGTKTYSNNYFGMMGEGRLLQYDSFGDSLKAFCVLIDTHYLSPEGKWHSGFTVKEVARRYCPHLQEFWTSRIEELMVQIYNDTKEDNNG